LSVGWWGSERVEAGDKEEVGMKSETFEGLSSKA
jgi:hypothetical protein